MQTNLDECIRVSGAGAGSRCLEYWAISQTSHYVVVASLEVKLPVKTRIIEPCAMSLDFPL